MLIPFKDINLGGVSASKWQGTKNSMARMIGFDIHSIPGLIKVNQKMTKYSGVIITEYCMVHVDCSNGIRYWFSSQSGKIWQDKDGTITLVYTTSPTSGDANCSGAREYNGYIYWATENYLHRIAVADADGASNWTANAAPNWDVFDNGSDYHPMREVNLVLFIADGNVVAQVDDTTFSSNAFDVSEQYTITALGKMNTYLLIGGSVLTANISEVFSWNTYATSYQTSDTVPERIINSFIEGDNYIYVNAGTSGSIYAYNGDQLQFYKRIPGDYSSTKTCIVNPNATSIFKGSLPIFGVSNGIGDACDEGIWSMGKYSLEFPTVFNMEFPTSNVDGDGYNILTGIEIGAILVSGVDIYQSWRRSATITVTIASPGVITYEDHGLTDGSSVVFSTTGALPTGITAGTIYYAHSESADTFTIYDTQAHAIAGGSTGQVNTTGTQSGVHTCKTVGIDKLDYSNKIVHPFMESRIIAPDRNSLQVYKKMTAQYVSLPSGTSIVFNYKKDHSSSFTDTTEITDTDRNQVYEEDRIEAKTLQMRVECVSSSNDAPTIEELDVAVE